jgi:hypothetical protein
MLLVFTNLLMQADACHSPLAYTVPEAEVLYIVAAVFATIQVRLRCV